MFAVIRPLRGFVLRSLRAAATIAVASLANASQAAEIHVPADYPTIQQALDAALEGDDVVVAPGTWPGSLEIPARAITLRSASGNPADTILDGTGTGESRPRPVVLVLGDPDGAQRIEGLTIRSGFGGISTSFLHEDPMLLVVEDCVIRENRAAGITLLGGSLEIRDSALLGNRGSFGAGLHSRGSAIVERCVFRGNLAFIESSPDFLTQGGGIYFNPFDDPGANLLVDDCEFTRNTCTDYGGAIHLTPNGTSTIRASRFFHNIAGVCAGAIYMFGSDDTVIENNLMMGNLSPQGGSIADDAGRFTVIRGNTIVASGGGGDCEGIRLHDSFNAVVENNIVAFGAGLGIARLGGFGGAIRCNDAFGNPLGDFSIGIPDPTNFSADPLFCDVESLDFTLRTNSPCAPPGVTGCGLVGALGVACGAIRVDAASWAEIKARYR